MFALLAVFYPLEFPHQFHQAVALNVYAQTFCQSQKPPAEAHLEAVEVAPKAFNHHRQRRACVSAFWIATGVVGVSCGTGATLV